MTETKNKEIILVQSKKNMSNIDINFIARELNQTLKDGFIDNIYEINQNLLLIKCRTKEGLKNLILDASRRINITNYQYPIPSYPTQYIISLRKHLKGRRILKIYQYEFDRILIIELSSKEQVTMKFIIELFLGGNFLLLNEKNQIILAHRYKIDKDRKILAKTEYEFPPTKGKNILKITDSEIKELLKQENNELVRAISRKFSLAGYYSEEICYEANVLKNKNCLDLTNEELEKIANSLLNFRNKIIISNNKGYIYVDDNNNFISFEPILLKIYGNAKFIEYSTFNESVDEFFVKLDSKLLMNIENKDDTTINKYERIKRSQIEQIEKLKGDRETNMKIGNLIYEHIDEIDNLLNAIKEARKKGFSFEEIEEKIKIGKEMGIKEAILFEKLYPKEGFISIVIDNISIKLNFTKDAKDNALEYYEQAKKDKRKIEGAKIALEKTEEMLKVESLEKYNKLKKEIPLIKRPKKKWYEKYRWFKTSDKFLVIGGKDATSNEVLVKKYMEPSDLFFHTDIKGAPIVILKNPENIEIEKIPELSIQESAIFAASYSNAWREGWGSTKIYYVRPHQVSKTPKAGEYLPKGSFYITGEKNFLPKPYLDVTFGLIFEPIENNTIEITSENIEKENIEIESNTQNLKSLNSIENSEIQNNHKMDLAEPKIYYPKIIAGPLSAIKKQTDIYVRLSPQKSSKLKGSKLAFLIKQKLIEKTQEPMKKWAELISLEEIIHLLPPGGSEILN